MAIAYDNSAIFGNAGSPDNVTYITGSASGMVMVVLAATKWSSSVSTSCTYNGISLTQIDNVTGGLGAFSSFYLAGPASGSNTLSFSNSGSPGVYTFAIYTYSGCSASTTPDNHAATTYTASGSQSKSITPKSTGALIISGAGVLNSANANNYSSFSNMNTHALANTNLNGSFAGLATGDSGVLGAPTSTTVTASGASATGNALLLISIAPALAAGGFLMFM